MNKEMYTKTFVYNWIFSIVLAIPIYFIFGYDQVYSFALGVLTTMFAMSYHFKTMSNVMEKNPDIARKTAVTSYVVRYVLYALVFAFALYREDIDMVFVFLGLVTFKIVLIIYTILYGKRGENDGANMD